MGGKIFRYGQDGFASALGLCILALLILIAMAAASLTRSGGTVAAEYEREMQLRLAAESGVLTAADTLERHSPAAGKLPAGGRRSVAVHDIPMAARGGGHQHDGGGSAARPPCCTGGEGWSVDGHCIIGSGVFL